MADTNQAAKSGQIEREGRAAVPPSPNSRPGTSSRWNSKKMWNDAKDDLEGFWARWRANSTG